MIANYRVQAELSAIDSTYDGKSIVLGTVDGCVSVLVITDPKKEGMKEYVANLPSRDEDVSKQLLILRIYHIIKRYAFLKQLYKLHT